MKMIEREENTKRKEEGGKAKGRVRELRIRRGLEEGRVGVGVGGGMTKVPTCVWQQEVVAAI